MTVDWLPELLLLDNYGGNWQRYEDEVYSRFYVDFIESRPTLEGMPVYVKRFLEKGKERGFWHLVQEGPVEKKREPDIRRCERIAWIRVIIEKAYDSSVKKWYTKRRNKTRYLLWLEEAEYLIVLEKRARAWVLWTAYCVVESHQKRKLQKQYRESLK